MDFVSIVPLLDLDKRRIKDLPILLGWVLHKVVVVVVVVVDVYRLLMHAPVWLLLLVLPPSPICLSIKMVWRSFDDDE